MSTARRGLALLFAAVLAGPLAADELPPPPPPPPGGWPRIDEVLAPLPFTAPIPAGHRVWVDADFLLGWVQRVATPIPLLTTGPATSAATAGVLGRPGVSVVQDGTGLAEGARGGGRLRLGGWLSHDETIGAEVGFFFLSPLGDDFAAASPGSPVLARPFLDTNNGGAPAAALLAFAAPGNPLMQSGAFAFQYNTRFWGLD